MKHDLTTGTWQDDTGCPISIILVTTSDDTEPVVTQWQRPVGPVASGVALDMLHQAMMHVLLHHLSMAIEMACDGGAFIRHRRLFRLT